MTSEWKVVSIEEIAAKTPAAMATGPFGSSISSKHFTDTGVPVIRGSNLSADVSCRLLDEGLVFVSPEKAKEFQRSVARRGDLVFTCWGTINQVGLIDETSRYSEYIVSNKQMKLTLDATRADARFVYYAFSAPDKQQEILDNGIGSSVPGFNLGQLRANKILLPPIQDQRRVVSMLRAFDDQIESLRHTNTTLEAIAQAIFKSWFIDFDPVKAKSEGRIPDGIDEATAALFPDSFEESALGAIPKGWTSTPLGEVLSSRSERVGDATVPEYASTNDGLVPREKIFTKQLSKSQTNNKLIRRGDLVFGLSRTTLNYGQMNEEIGSVSSAYKVFQVDSSKVVPQLLGRLITTRKDYFFNAVSASSREGQSVSTSSLERLQFACPPMEVQDALYSTLRPFLDLVACNDLEIAALVELRDTLLPRLISGKLRLPELQEVAEAL